AFKSWAGIDGWANLCVNERIRPEGVTMSLGEDAGEGIGFATARSRDWPSVRQFNVFLENRLGGLLNVVRRFETTDIHIVALHVEDHENAVNTLARQGFTLFTESDFAS